MSYDSYSMERKTGLKRKAADDLQEAQPKKHKRDGELDEEDEGDPDLLKDEIDSIQRELDMLDAELKKSGADVEMSDLHVEPAVDFSEDVDDHSEIHVDDDTRSLSQSRSRRIPRPNRNFSNYEVDPIDDQRSAVVPPVVTSPPLNNFYGSASKGENRKYTAQPVVIQPPVRRPPTPSKIKVSRGRGGATPAATPGVTAASNGGRAKATGRGSRGKWKPILPAPTWSIPRKSATTESVVPPKKGPDPMTLCGRILRDLMKHKHAWVFLQPVDVKSLGLHDYYKIIKRPMDLGTIQVKLTNIQYANVNEFAEDVRLTFRNAMLYNPAQHDVHIMAKSLLQIFEDKLPKAVEVESADPAMKKLHLEQTAQRYRNFEEKLKVQLESVQKDLEKSRITEINDVSPALRQKDSLPDAVIEYEEKCKIAQSINTLGLRFMKGLFQIFEEEKPEYIRSESEIIDVETDRLSNTLLRRLEGYVADCRALERSSLGTSLATSQSTSTQNSIKSQPTTTTTTTNTTSSTTTTPVTLPTTSTSTTNKATPQPSQGGKQPTNQPEGAKKEESEESSSSSSDSSSSDESSDSDSDDNANNNKKSKKKQNVTPVSITITTTANSNSAPNGAAPPASAPTPTTATSTATVTTIAAPISTPHTTIPGIAVMTPKPFILPTQKEEKQVVIMNQDSWSGLVSGGNSNAAAIIPVGIPPPKPEIPDLGGRKLSSDASEAAAALASIHPVAPIVAQLVPPTPVLAVPTQPVPIQPIQPIQPQRPPTAIPAISAISAISPIQPPTQQNHVAAQIGAVIQPPTSGNPAEGAEFGGALWEDMKKRMALNKQREKDRAEIEAELQRQQEEEKKRVERELQARKQAEEERKRKEQEEERQRQIEREQEVERLREEERAKREKAGPSVNLTSQSEIMANFERGVFGQGGSMGMGMSMSMSMGMGMGMGSLDVTSLLGLKRRDDDED